LIKPNEHEEIPHVTIARIKSSQHTKQLKSVLAQVKTIAFGKMDINKVVLYESVLTPNGPVYTIIEEFPFR